MDFNTNTNLYEVLLNVWRHYYQKKEGHEEGNTSERYIAFEYGHIGNENEFEDVALFIKKWIEIPKSTNIDVIQRLIVAIHFIKRAGGECIKILTNHHTSKVPILKVLTCGGYSFYVIDVKPDIPGGQDVLSILSTSTHTIVSK